MMRGIKGVAAFWALSFALTADTRDDGISAFQAGRYSIALEKLKNVARSDMAGQTFLGLTEAALDDCSAALPRLTSVKDTETDLYRMANLAAAKCYSAVGNQARTFAVLETLERKFPNDADVLYLNAKLHMKAFNDATLQMFERTPGSYRVHELSAEIFEVENRYGEATAEYRKAIELNPTAPDLHFRLGRALLMQNHDKSSLEQASAAFSEELRVNPEDGACEFQLGQIAQVQGNASEAKSHFERALALSPSFVQAMIALGKIKTQEKDWPRAISLLIRATELQPTNEMAHYALLTAYRDSGDMEKAKAERETLARLQKPPAGEFSDFLKRLGAQKQQE